MYYPDEVIDEVRNASDIVSVISSVVNLQKKGGRYFGLCPFHNEKTGSFSVSPDKQMYYCFGCGVGGNVISFVMDYENYGFVEAVNYLADRAGITLPQVSESDAAKTKAGKNAKILEMYKDAATFYYKQLRAPVGKVALEYFAKRGLTMETINKFGLGYAPQNSKHIYDYLKSKGHTDEIIRDAAFLKIDERGAFDAFWNRPIFPIMDVKNRVIGFGGRILGDGEPKYLNSKESPVFDKSRNLFGLNFARKSRRKYMILCEGYMDVIALHQAGFDSAVASLGTAFTPGHASLIKRYVDEVILTFDSDEAGTKARLRAIPILKGAGLRVKTINMQPYKDPDEFIKALGADEFEKRINESTNAFYFETDEMQKRYDMNDPESKTNFHRELAGKLAQFTDTLERENYLSAVCARYMIKEDYLREMVNYIGGKTFSEGAEPKYNLTGAGVRKPEVGKGTKTAERTVLSWVASSGKSFEELSRFIRPEYFSDDVVGRLADKIFSIIESGEKVNPAAIIDEYSEDSEIRDEVAKVFASELPEEEDDAKALLSENIKMIKRDYINVMLRTTLDPAKLQELIKEKSELDRKPVDII